MHSHTYVFTHVLASNLVYERKQTFKPRKSKLVWFFDPVSFLFSSLDDTIGDYYYFNVNTGETQWAHPLDEIYKQKVIVARQQFDAGADHPEDQGILEFQHWDHPVIVQHWQ